jgi:DNA-directed RNA polymerase specialized sigma24 family protein
VDVLEELHELPFEELYEWMRQRIFPRIVKLTRNRADAEDVFHDMALTVWQAIENKTLRNPRALIGYIQKTALFSAWGIARQKRRIDYKSTSLPDSEWQSSQFGVRSHEDRIIAKELLERGLSKLNPRYRYALLTPKTDEEQAKELGTSLHAIRLLRWKAHKQMRELLSRNARR